MTITDTIMNVCSSINVEVEEVVTTSPTTGSATIPATKNLTPNLIQGRLYNTSYSSAIAEYSTNTDLILILKHQFVNNLESTIRVDFIRKEDNSLQVLATRLAYTHYDDYGIPSEIIG